MRAGQDATPGAEVFPLLRKQSPRHSSTRACSHISLPGYVPISCIHCVWCIFPTLRYATSACSIELLEGCLENGDERCMWRILLRSGPYHTGMLFRVRVADVSSLLPEAARASEHFGTKSTCPMCDIPLLGKGSCQIFTLGFKSPYASARFIAGTVSATSSPQHRYESASFSCGV